jgi:hypothetical protein
MRLSPGMSTPSKRGMVLVVLVSAADGISPVFVYDAGFCKQRGSRFVGARFCTLHTVFLLRL